MDINTAIYLDYNATTPVAPEVVNEMLPHFLSAYGNASSSDHILGWQAKEAVEEARETIARSLKVKSQEIIFTAGATEAINLVLRGLDKSKKNHIITLKSEHNAVLDTCKALEEEGVKLTYLGVDENGIINLEELSSAITDKTLLVSVMFVNNETGVIQPIKEIAAICEEKRTLFMSDATQAIGKMQVDIEELGIDIIVGSAHKFYGPKGVGFLYLKEELTKSLQPVITGGGQELKKRAGTTNVPGIIGMAKALELADELMVKDIARIEGFRDHFENQLNKALEIDIVAKYAVRMYNCSNLCFKNTDSQQIMLAIGGRVAASRGSACSSGKIEPSHVLTAMGILEEDALASIRFSFGRYITLQEADAAIDLIIDSVNRLKVG